MEFLRPALSFWRSFCTCCWSRFCLRPASSLWFLRRLSGFFLWPKAKSLLLSAYKRDYVSQQNTTAAWKKVQWELLKIDSKSTSSSSFFGQLILHGLFLLLHHSSLIPKNQTSNSDEIMIDFHHKFHFYCTVITLGSLFWFCAD